MDQHDPQTEAYMGQLMAAQPRLRTYLRMLIYNPTDVNDLMQEVATIGWKKFNSFDKSRSFDAWLLGIARICVFEYIRDQQKRASPLTDEVIELLEAEAEDASASAPLLLDALDACLGKLATDDYRLVRARFEKAQTKRGVSKLLNLGESTVSRSLNRIYAQLLLCIKRQEREQGQPGVQR